MSAAFGLRAPALLVGAGCGAFLLPELAPAGWRCLSYGRDVARIGAAGQRRHARVGRGVRAERGGGRIVRQGPALMWVVKLGGSLNTDPRLPEWLELLVQLGGGRVAVVCGGGVFADEVRRSQAHWRFNDLAAHNMAVLAMAQTTYLAQALNPKLHLATSKAEIRDVLRGGHTALWLPMELVSERPDAHTNWDAASDSIALDLARKLNAERLVVVKSCADRPGRQPGRAHGRRHPGPPLPGAGQRRRLSDRHRSQGRPGAHALVAARRRPTDRRLSASAKTSSRRDRAHRFDEVAQALRVERMAAPAHANGAAKAGEIGCQVGQRTWHAIAATRPPARPRHRPPAPRR